MKCSNCGFVNRPFQWVSAGTDAKPAYCFKCKFTEVKEMSNCTRCHGETTIPWIQEYSGTYSRTKCNHCDGTGEEPAIKPVPIISRESVPQSFLGLYDMCVNHIDAEPEKDITLSTLAFKNYVYEAAIEAVYGSTVWDWINKR